MHPSPSSRRSCSAASLPHIASQKATYDRIRPSPRFDRAVWPRVRKGLPRGGPLVEQHTYVHHYIIRLGTTGHQSKAPGRKLSANVILGLTLDMSTPWRHLVAMINRMWKPLEPYHRLIQLRSFGG